MSSTSILILINKKRQSFLRKELPKLPCKFSASYYSKTFNDESINFCFYNCNYTISKAFFLNNEKNHHSYDSNCSYSIDASGLWYSTWKRRIWNIDTFEKFLEKQLVFILISQWQIAKKDICLRREKTGMSGKCFSARATFQYSECEIDACTRAKSHQLYL